MRLFCCAIVLCFYVIAVDFAVAAPDNPEIFAQTGHSGTVTSVVFSPDGKHLASGSDDKTVKLWDLSTGREVTTFRTKTEVNAVAFSPDGRRLASCGGNNFITLWEVENGQKALDIRVVGEHNYVHDVVFSPDGAIIAAVSYNIQLFDSRTGRNIKIIQADTSSLGSLAFSPNGRYLATGSSSNEFAKNSKPAVRLWDLHSGKELIRFEGHPPGYIQVKFSPDGKQITSIGRDKNIFVWDIKTRKKVRTLVGHTYDYGSIAFSPDNRHVISADFHAMTLWDLSTGSIKLALKDDEVSSNSISFASGGTLVAVSAGKAISLWDVSRGTKIRTFGGDVESSYPAHFSADQQKIVIRVPGGVRVFNSRLGIRDSMRTMVETWDYDSRFFLESNDENSSIVDTKTGRAIITIPSSVLLEVMEKVGIPKTFSADGHYALLSDQNMDSLKIFDIRNNELVSRLEGFPQNYTTSLKALFSPDGRFLVGWPKDSLVVWNTKTGRQIVKTALKRLVFSAVFTSDGTQIVLAGSEGRIDLLEVATGKTIRTFAGHLNSVNTIALSGDERYLLSGDWDGKIKLWDFQTGSELKTFSGHTNWVFSAMFSDDNAKLVSSSSDGTTRLWDIAFGNVLVKIINFSDGEWISITPAGYYNASPGGDKHLNVRVGKNVYGIENYREAFFRPDLVKLVLAGGSLQGYRTLADVKQPPKVSIIQTPASSSTAEFKLTLRLEEQGGGIGDVRLFLNGSAILLDSSRSLKAVQKDGGGGIYRNYTFRLSPGSNTIRAIAFNADNSMQSNDAVHQVVANFAATRKPTLHALVIGIQEFKNPKLQLKYAVADARLFEDALKKGATGLFEQVKVTSLTSRDATSRDSLINALHRYRSIHPDDLFILYIASHGTVDEGEYFLLTSNVSALSSHRLKNDALPQTELKELVANIPSTKKMIVLDTCSAATLGNAIQAAMLTRGLNDETAMKILSRAVGSTILSASTSGQDALEGYQGHGLFTWALVQGLLGKADKGKTGFVRTNDLATYVEDEVPIISEKVFKRVQQPSASINGQSFPLSRVK